MINKDWNKIGMMKIVFVNFSIKAIHMSNFSFFRKVFKLFTRSFSTWNFHRRKKLDNKKRRLLIN